MADTALIIFAPEVNDFVASFCDKYDPAAATGVDAHVTLIFPFMPTELLTSDVEDQL